MPRRLAVAVAVALILIALSGGGQVALSADRQECSAIGSKRFRPDTPAYRRTVAAVDRIVSVLLAEGFALRDEFLGAMAPRPDHGIGTFNRLMDTLWGAGLESQITDLRNTNRYLTDKFLRYDEKVSDCIRQIGTGWETELFTRLEFVLRAQQVASERDTVRQLLSDFRGAIGGLENERNTRIARFLTGFGVFLVVVQIVLAMNQHRMVKKQQRSMDHQTALISARA